jgi:hypothetical protein
MEDAIFLRLGEGLVEMPLAAYPSETELQRYLAEHPGLLPGAQINEEAPRRWLLVDREVGVPADEGGSAHFAIDHLFVDQDAIPTLVEVKRGSNRQLRREVVGQMLDYAANGVRYWPVEGLRGAFERRCEAEGASPQTLVSEFSDGATPDQFWAQVAENLATGRVRLVFAADQIPTELQTVIEFLNEQMERIEVLGVEIKQYAGSGHQALVPRIIGMTGAAKHAKARGGSRGYAELLDEADSVTRRIEGLLESLIDEVGLVSVRSPQSRRFDSSDGTLLRLYPQWNAVEVALGPIRGAGLEREADAILERMNELAGKALPERYPLVACDVIEAQWVTFRAEILPELLRLRREATELERLSKTSAVREGGS